MKVFIVSLCSFFILLVVIGINFHYVRGVTDRICRETEALIFSEEEATSLYELESFWKEQHFKLSFSVSHRELSCLDEALCGLRSAYETKNRSDFEHYRLLVLNAANDIARLESFSAENIF